MTPRSCRLAVLASHPIQYFTPLYRLLAATPGIDIDVMFCRDFGVRPSYDRQFAREIRWDTDQLSGYRSRFLRNVSPVTDTFNPLHAINPGAFTRVLRGYDALWINGYAYPSNWLALFAAKLGRTKVLFRSDFRLQRTRRRRAVDPVRDRVIRTALAASDALLYVGEANRDAYLAYGADPERLFFTPFSVDVDRFAVASTSDPRERQRRREQWGIPHDRVVALFAGKLTERKHPEALLEISGGDRRLHIVFAGSGPLEAPLRERCARDRRDDVTFLGFVNQHQLPAVYALADLFVMPSEYEPWGLALNEAMAAGLAPLVSDDVGAVPDLITEGRTGFVFRSGDWNQLAALVGSLVEDAPMRRRVAVEAAKRSSAYSFDATVAGLLDALRALQVYRPSLQTDSHALVSGHELGNPSAR